MEELNWPAPFYYDTVPEIPEEVFLFGMKLSKDKYIPEKLSAKPVLEEIRHLVDLSFKKYKHIIEKICNKESIDQDILELETTHLSLNTLLSKLDIIKKTEEFCIFN